MGWWLSLAIEVGCGRRLALVALCLGVALLGCSGVSGLPRGFDKLWNEYREMPDERAMAIAGDPEHLWVAGATGGHRTREAALEAALAECERRRLVRRVVSLCRLYAVGERKILAHGE